MAIAMQMYPRMPSECAMVTNSHPGYLDSESPRLGRLHTLLKDHDFSPCLLHADTIIRNQRMPSAMQRYQRMPSECTMATNSRHLDSESPTTMFFFLSPPCWRNGHYRLRTCHATMNKHAPTHGTCMAFPAMRAICALLQWLPKSLRH